MFVYHVFGLFPTRELYNYTFSIKFNHPSQ